MSHSSKKRRDRLELTRRERNQALFVVIILLLILVLTFYFGSTFQRCEPVQAKMTE